MGLFSLLINPQFKQTAPAMARRLIADHGDKPFMDLVRALEEELLRDPPSLTREGVWRFTVVCPDGDSSTSGSMTWIKAEAFRLAYGKKFPRHVVTLRRMP